MKTRQIVLPFLFLSLVLLLTLQPVTVQPTVAEESIISISDKLMHESESSFVLDPRTIAETSAAMGSQWASNYGGDEDDEAFSVQETSDGGVIVAGQTYSFGAGNWDVWVLKLNSDGSVAWQKTYGGSFRDRAMSIQETDDGGYIFAGHTESFASGDENAWIVKLNSNGTIDWQKFFGGSGSDSARSIQQTRDGGYIFAGYSNSTNGGFNFWVVKLTSDGSITWQKTYDNDNAYTDQANSIIETSDGDFLVAGYTGSYGADTNDAWIIKINSVGNIIWQRSFGGNLRDGFESVQETRDGNIIITGYTKSFGTGELDGWVVKLNSEGAVIWQKTIGGSANDYFLESTESASDGSVIVAGYSSIDTTGDQAWVVKLASDGSVIWQKKIGVNVRSRAYSIHGTASGGFILAGKSWGVTRSELWVAAFDNMGTIPDCTIVSETNAVILDSSALGTTTNATTETLSIGPADTSILPQDTLATVDVICELTVSPFLDLPINYSTTSFAKAARGNVGGNGGRVNAWFDHTSPNYSENNNLTRWNGIYSGTSSVNKYECEIQDLSCYDGHNGIDFQKRMTDEPILAAASGVVFDIALSNSGYGNRVWVDHENGYATLYAHLKSISVVDGERVTSGQSIGTMGNSGVSIGTTGTHLHFGVYYDQNGDNHWAQDEVVDPYGWNPLVDPNQNDPWSVTSHYLWQYPLNVQATVDNTGGSISSVSGETTLNIPSGALSSLVTLDVWEAPPVAGASAQLRSTGSSLWLRVLEWLSGSNTLMSPTATNEFNQPIAIAIDYSEIDMVHLDENQLAIHWWDTINNEWQMLSTTVDTVQKTATAQTTQVGNFNLQAPLTCSSDVREPDDNYYAATYVLSDGVLWNQRFDIAQDEDWFKFEATANKIYLVETANLAAGVDTRLEIYAQDGLTLLASDDNGGNGAASRLEWVASQDGIHFIRIVPVLASNNGCNSTYDLSIQEGYSIYLPAVIRD